MITVLFWDIDGTLLTTQRAGLFAIEEACRTVLGGEVDYSAIDMRGVPDTEIAARILHHAGHAVDDAAIRRFLEVYERHLPDRLGWKSGRALPGVRAVLESMHDRRDVLSMLLTGNTAAGAAAKLRHYELAEFFALGAFADGCRERVDIARKALALAEQHTGAPVPPERRFVIGDTPHDVACAEAIGARTIAVATGGYTADELQACGAWRVWPQIPPPAEFQAAIGLS